MSVRYVFLVSFIMLICAPSWSAEKSQRNAGRGPASVQKDTELGRIYEALIRDSRKQLAPSPLFFPTIKSEAVARGPASEPSLITVRTDSRYHLTAGNHSAMPWAAEGSLAGADFSVK